LVETAAAIVVDLDSADCAVGVGAAGLVDLNGHLGYAPNLPLIRDAPLRDALEQATGRVVVLDNDANAAAIGERAYGAARDVDHALFVTLGTGIGGGMLLDGRVYRGGHHLGGEIGHFTVERDGPLCACGERGHWEAIASGNALGRMAREMVAGRGGGAIVAAAGGDARAVTGEHVGAAAAAGDNDAQEVLLQYAENVALGLAGLANILDPERIVIAGGIVELGALLFGPLREAFGRHLEGVDYRPAIELVPAELGERAGAVGAAVLARGGQS
jgi:glucokinase